MHRFFVKQNQLNDTPIVIIGQDYNHMKNVLRLKRGEEILLCDGGDKEYLCVITDYNTEKEEVLLEITDIFANARELPAKITLFQGYPKGDKLENIVQKAVELGVFEIIPVKMKRCVVRLDEKKAEKKVERLNAISLSARKQSKRGIVPQVLPVMSMEQACRYAESMDYILLPYENAEGMDWAKNTIKEACGKKHIGVFIGPEGGFEQSEVMMIEKIGGNSFSLGHRILRTETAGITVLSLLMFLLDRDSETGTQSL